SVSYRHRTLLLGLGRDKSLSAQQQVEYPPLCPKSSKPAKSLAPQRRRGLVQRPLATAPMRRCWIPAAPVALVCQPDRPHPSEISRCVAVLLLRATSAHPMAADQNKRQVQESKM